VTKKIHEIDYLPHYYAKSAGDGNVTTIEAPSNRLPRTRVIVLEAGRIVFDGSVEDFAKSSLPAIKEMLTIDRHDHSVDPEFTDPWDKRRRPTEAIL
jgi:hypothetical protein